jgi:hypothetical protein
MFNKDFFPTPANVIELMMQGEVIENRVFLEPSAGKGNIVDYLIENGAKSVISCENNEDLKKILQTKCKVIESDFLALTSEKISHIDTIVMNPPFSADENHILHAYSIAPAGCKIIALCNYSTIENPYTTSRKQLKVIIDNFGSVENLGDCFSDAERKTGVNVGLIKLQKAGSSYKDEFNGFFMDDDPEQRQENGIMSYNVVRDLVNRYVQAVKIYGEMLTVKSRLSSITGNFFGGELGIKATLSYEDYKKELQKAGWMFILNKMNLTKYTTKGVKEDINKFVEQQTAIPFTMRNIYHMLDIVVQTAGQRMDKAILEVFDRITEHHHDNRHNVKGWKTNGHYLVGKKFILPYQISPAKEYGYTSETYHSLRSSYDGTIPDFEKALCFVEGIQYDQITTVNSSINRNTYGEWYESHFFKYKGYKNGNMHFEFKDSEVWARFNQRVAKLKGFPLFEGKEQTAYQDRQTGRAYQEKKKAEHAFKPTVIFEI